MGYDDYLNCPNCGEFMGLKSWLGETGFNEQMTEYTIEITSAVCKKCGTRYKLKPITIPVKLGKVE